MLITPPDRTPTLSLIRARAPACVVKADQLCVSVTPQNSPSTHRRLQAYGRPRPRVSAKGQRHGEDVARQSGVSRFIGRTRVAVGINPAMESTSCRTHEGCC